MDDLPVPATFTVRSSWCGTVLPAVRQLRQSVERLPVVVPLIALMMCSMNEFRLVRDSGRPNSCLR